MGSGKFIHPQAICDSSEVGENTRIWAFAHVLRGARIGAECNIGDGAFVESGAVIGDRVTVKNQVMIWDGVQIHDDAFIGPGVIFTNDLRPRSPRMSQARERYAEKSRWCIGTTVGRGASVGAGAIIVAGLKIGEYAMVAAGAVVTRDVRPYELVAGNPARPRGWVCACGAKLPVSLRCESCGDAFEESGKLLIPQKRGA